MRKITFEESAFQDFSDGTSKNNQAANSSRQKGGGNHNEPR